MRALIFTALLALPALPALAETQTAVVAGGCFWCVEADFEKVPGVIEVTSGFTGGTVDNPSYKEVSNGGTGHFEAVEIRFESDKISYARLMDLFLRSIDLLDAGGQFCDRGDSYRTAIFATDAQRSDAEAAIAKAAASLGKIPATPVLPAQTFWPAGAEHQDYYKGTGLVITRAGPKKQSNAYKFYREACGRDARVKEIWGDEAAFVK